MKFTNVELHLTLYLEHTNIGTPMFYAKVNVIY